MLADEIETLAGAGIRIRLLTLIVTVKSELFRKEVHRDVLLIPTRVLATAEQRDVHGALTLSR